MTVSRRGYEFGAYGHYIGGTIARDVYADHIVVYQDTLERDFGHSPDLLRAQVERTVKHGSPPTTWAGTSPACAAWGCSARSVPR